MSGRMTGALRGFLVHHDRITLDGLVPNGGSGGTTDDSRWTEVSPRPGLAVPDDPRSAFEVRAHGAQGESIDLAVVRPGAVGQAGLVYSETTPGAFAFDTDDWRGWEEPNVFRGWYPIKWSITEDWWRAAAITDPETQQVVVVASEVTGSAGPTAWVWDPVTAAFGAGVTIDPNTSYDLIAACRLARTGRIVAWYCEVADGTLRSRFSDDLGASWEQYDRDGGAGVTIDSGAMRMSAVEAPSGAVLLLVSDASTNWWLYRSEDGGVSFEETESGTGIGRGALQVMQDGRILVVYRADTTLYASYRILADEYDLLDTATEATLDGNNAAAWVAPVVDWDGAVYVYITRDASDVVRLVRSLDHGSSWSAYTNNPHGAALAGPAAVTVTDYRYQCFAAAATGGEILVIGNTSVAAAVLVTDGSLVAMRFGGWTTAEMIGGSQRTARGSYGSSTGSVFVPMALLSTYGWTATGVGSLLSSGEFAWASVGAINSDAWTNGTALSGRSTQTCRLRVDAAPSGTVGVVQSQRATRQVRIEILSATSFRVRDQQAGATLATITSFATTTDLEFMFAWEGADECTVLFRRGESSRWFVAVEATGLTAGVGVAQGMTIGVLTAGVTVTVRARWCAMSSNGVVRGLTGASDLAWGKALGPSPYPVRDQGSGDDRLFLSGVSGATRHGETWTIPTRADHGVREMFPQLSPSPDAYWASDDSIEFRFIWDFTDRTRLGSSWALALALLNTSFRTAYVEGSNAPATWTTIGTYDAAVVDSYAYQLQGHLLRPGAASASASRWWAPGELDGGYVVLDPLGSSKVRRIRRQHGGLWEGGAGMPVVIELEDIDGTEASTGSATIVAPGGVLVVVDNSTSYERYRVRIPTDPDRPDRTRCGQMVLGSVVVPGRQWSRGFSWRVEPRVVVESDDTGTMWPERRGPELRELTVSWQDGYDDTPTRDGTARYLSAGAATPALSGEQWVWPQLAGLLREADGGALPVVALLEVPETTQTITDPSMYLAGLMQGRLQRNHVQGDEGRSDVYRVESVTVREQPWTRRRDA